MWRIRAGASILLLLTAAAAPGCSRHKVISREELRSTLKSAISFAAESEAFIDYARQGRATRRYAEGHAVYLQEEVKRAAEGLERGNVERSVEGAAGQCKSQLLLLQQEVRGIQTNIGNDRALAERRERIEAIRKSLQQAYSSL